MPYTLLSFCAVCEVDHMLEMKCKYFATEGYKIVYNEYVLHETR